MVEIECLACGKTIRIPSYIDTEKYDGEVRCPNPKCKAFLHVKLVKGKLQKRKIVKELEPAGEPIKIQKIQYVPAKKAKPQELGDKPKRE